MSLRSAKNVNNNTEAHVKEPNKEHDKGHAGETSEKAMAETEGKEAHQPQGAAPRLQRPPVRAPGPQEGSKEERHQGKLVLRGLNSETMVTLEELVPLGYPQERILTRRIRTSSRAAVSQTRRHGKHTAGQHQI
jgi:hypothetical protein